MNVDFKYPEMRNFSWAKELEEILGGGLSKAVNRSGGLLCDQPKIPINLLLEVMKEATAHPEVMAAYASAPIDGTIPPREGHLITWFNEYLRHKHGNSPDIAGESIMPMRKLANGYYSDINDKKLIQELSMNPFIDSEEGANHA